MEVSFACASSWLIFSGVGAECRCRELRQQSAGPVAIDALRVCAAVRHSSFLKLRSLRHDLEANIRALINRIGFWNPKPNPKPLNR